jgi:hypothetical protein
LALVADFLHLIRTQPGDDGCPRNRIQGIELLMDVVHGQSGRLALVAQLGSRGGQDSGGRQQQQQRCPDDSRRWGSFFTSLPGGTDRRQG